MNQSLIIASNILAVTVLVFRLYYPRYRRKDMVVAILSLNIGLMAVATALASAEVSAGLGLGLFGVLSIIRLRSSELAQEEVAYYFSALALGLLAGMQVDPVWLTPALMFALVSALYVGDHPLLFADTRHQTVHLGTAYTCEADLIAHLEGLLDADVLRVKVKKVDIVNDTTLVDVRFRVRPASSSQGDSHHPVVLSGSSR